MSLPAVHIYAAIRTPRGRVRKAGGSLADIPAYDLLAGLMHHIQNNGFPTYGIEDVIIGVNTLMGEQSVGLAKTAMIRAGWPHEISGGTVSRMCTSGLNALAQAAAAVRSQAVAAAAAGGAENMTRVPMFSDRPQFLLDPEPGEQIGFVTIGVAADALAAKYGLTRTQLDDYAVRSHELANSAPPWESLVPVVDPRNRKEVLLSADEGVRPDTTSASLAQLPALFARDPLWERAEQRGLPRPQDGLHTVATAPQLADAASLAVLASPEFGAQHDLQSQGQVLSWSHASVPSPGLDSAAPAAAKALAAVGLSFADLHVIEVNESFSATPLVFSQQSGIPLEDINTCGGAVAVGHPLGATGGILLTNALEQLHRRGGGNGLLVIPAALGVSMAVVIKSN